MTGNTVRIAPNRLRSPREIVAIVELVAAELDSDVRISVQLNTVEVVPPLR